MILHVPAEVSDVRKLQMVGYLRERNITVDQESPDFEEQPFMNDGLCPVPALLAAVAVQYAWIETHSTSIKGNRSLPGKMSFKQRNEPRIY